MHPFLDVTSTQQRPKFPWWMGKVLLGLLLLVAASLQLNDDLPWLWGGMYVLSALCFFASLSAFFSWLIPAGWSTFLALAAIYQYQREELPFWNNAGCAIGSDVPGILFNGLCVFGLCFWQAWEQRPKETLINSK